MVGRENAAAGICLSGIPHGVVKHERLLWQEERLTKHIPILMLRGQIKIHIIMRENLRIGSIIMIIAGLVLAYVSMNKGKDKEVLLSTGIEVPGKLMKVEVNTRVGRRSGTKNWLTVEYTPKEQAPIATQFQVTDGFLASISKGNEVTVETVPVVYSAADPKNAIIRGGSTGDGAGAEKIMLFIAAVGGVGFLLSLIPLGKR